MTDAWERTAIGRRSVAAAGAAGMVAMALPGVAAVRAPAAEILLFAGTYAAEHGGGLYPIRYQPADDRWSVGAPDPIAANASFGVRHRRSGLYHLLDEQAAGQVGSYRPTAEGWIRLGPARSTGGADPCHAALDPTERWLAVANYSSGSIALFGIDPASGAAMADPVVRVHSGQGPNRDRQAGPHAHWVGFRADGRYLYAVDLGTDSVMGYAFDAASGTLGPGFRAFAAPGGSGPRHLAFHPRLPIAYLVSEMGNSLTTLAPDREGRWRAVGRVSTLPAGFTGASYAAHIALNRRGDRLYVSNRGHNSVAVHALDGAGRATLLQHASCGGNWPRFFLLMEDQARLLVANQRSGTVVPIPILRDGRLGAASEGVRVPGVAYLGRV